jgi:hypothetical protein
VRCAVAIAMTETTKNRVTIYGPEADGAYWVEFGTADGPSASRNA